MCRSHDHLNERGWVELEKEMSWPRKGRKEKIGLLLFLYFLLALLFS